MVEDYGFRPRKPSQKFLISRNAGALDLFGQKHSLRCSVWVLWATGASGAWVGFEVTIDSCNDLTSGRVPRLDFIPLLWGLHFIPGIIIVIIHGNAFLKQTDERTTQLRILYIRVNIKWEFYFELYLYKNIINWIVNDSVFKLNLELYIFVKESVYYRNIICNILVHNNMLLFISSFKIAKRRCRLNVIFPIFYPLFYIIFRLITLQMYKL